MPSPRARPAPLALRACLAWRRRFDEAITACQDAAAVFRETGGRHGEVAALNSLGLALVEMRRFDEPPRTAPEPPLRAPGQ